MESADTWKSRLRQVSADATGSLVRFAPVQGSRLGVSFRTAIAIAIPVAIGVMFGRLDLGLQAAVGAFTALFGAALLPKERAKLLPILAILILAIAGLGSWFVQWTWMFGIGLVAVAILTFWYGLATRLGPPGPLFFVLVYGISGMITGFVGGGSAPGSTSEGARRADPLVFLLMVACGAILSILIAISPMMLPKYRGRATKPFRELLAFNRLRSGETELLLRVCLAATVGALISLLWFDSQHAYWTVAASVAVIGITPVRGASLNRALHRSLGTIVGVGLFLLIAPLVEYPILVIVMLGALQFAIEFTVVRHYATAMVFITPLVLIINGTANATTDIGEVALLRLGDTLLGSVLALLSLLPFVHRRSQSAAPVSPPR